ncbi:HK97 gp10 family phage protein [Clostridium cuniculi]|uniref:HK97 gp10 family phage protein n=1 Tax=Clostridium cuniculi TaxID=2548455 RepID=UPI00105617E0|nr:HK97 gp10 family phage protein [Clostridium cuniculi]
MSKVNINGISKEFAKILSDYKEEVEEGISIAGDKVAKKTVSNLRKNSPKRKKNGGAYAKGWRVSTIKGKRIIHNKTKYQLTHLLENGHAKVNGGKVDGIPHIKPAEEEAIKEYVSEVKKVIKR